MIEATRIVVADAGPLLHLDELGAFSCLNDLGEILVPPTVQKELQKHRSSLLKNSPPLLLLTESPIDAVVDALTPFYTLHHGEREALACCRQFTKALLLTDDTAARMAAQTLSIPAHGTLGLLIRAARQGHYSAPQVLEFLQAIPAHTTLHIRPSLLQDIIQQVRREWSL